MRLEGGVMSTAVEPPPTRAASTSATTRPDVRRTALLACGILSSLLYGTIMLVVRYKGYSLTSQTVSELSAWGVSTRSLWMVLGSVYEFLIIAFGLGVLLSARDRLALRVAGWLLVAYGTLGVLWPFVAMHQRAVLAAGGRTLADTGHLTLAATTVILMFVAMGFGAAARKGWFRVYSVVSMVVLLAFGGLTSSDASRVQANLPTPWVGVWERINIGVFLLWVVVLAIALLRERDGGVDRGSGTPGPQAFYSENGGREPPVSRSVLRPDSTYIQP
jgi:hypothetical protein